MKLSSILLLCVVLIMGVASQGVPYRQAPIQRRQLTSLQQNHILTDIQKHQHRFNLHPQPQQQRNQFSNFVQHPSQSFAFPPQTSLIPNAQLNQPPPAFRHQQQPQQPQQQSRQSQFQRSAGNQIGQPTFHQPPQFTHISQQQPIISEQFGGFGPIASPLVQQPPIRPSANFFPSGQVQFPQVTAPVNPFLQPTQSLPLEQRSNVFLDARSEEQRQREELARQKLIEKHEKFAQKYYQNQQAQVSRLHEDFVKRQKTIQEETQEKLRPQQSQQISNHYVRHQNVKQSDIPAFEKSVSQYYQQHPTPTTPIPTTTSHPLTVIPLAKKPKVKPEVKTLNADDIKLLLQNGDRQSILSQLKQEAPKSTKSKSKSPLSRDDLLKQLKQALAEESQDLGGQNLTTQDIVLPNGEKVQVIRTTDPELIRRAKNGQLVEPLPVSGPTPAPISIEDLAKSGLLPPGTDFEVIRQSANGLQKVEKVPAQKKVTFVYLEEQDDGSYKVQGVKSNSDKEIKTTGKEVDSILTRIKNGEINLPPTAKKVVAPIEIPTPATTKVTTPRVTTISRQRYSSSTTTPLPKNHRASANTVPNTVKYSPSPSPTAKISPVTPVRQSPRPAFHFSFSTTTQKPEEDNGRSPYSTLPTFASSERHLSVSPRIQRLSSTETPEYATASSINFIRNAEAQKLVASPSISTVTTAAPTFRSSIAYSPTFTTTQATTTTTKQADLADVLKNNGLFAMAKYLKQSGLDSILNETGPYTIFAPTDKAFKSLLIQLGGPEKAEEKFRNNPRLLSGLLLHHVIPGAFKIDDLQDEMTGVSLAGTQLRVNQYQMQDTQWNDIKVTTINGATVVLENRDIDIPQGIAHAVDRVMFPLPVGDILQTLQSDRERRFTNFLRAVFTANMADTLQNKGIKTYTVFAPTDFAFSHLTPEELNAIVSDKDSAQQLVNRHLVPGTLFTSGMRFYQVKDTLAEDKSITVQKNGGKVKVNESTIVTSNVPSTNGVIHAIDSLL